MKKLVSLLLVFVMALSFATAALAATTSDTQTVNITGKLEKGGESIKISLKRDDSPVYMNKVQADENGNYSTSFKYKGDISNIVVSVEQGRDVLTNTVTSATAQAETVSYSFDVSEFASKIEEIKNTYNPDEKIVAVISYGVDNRLLSVQTGLDNAKVVDSAKTVKVFVYAKDVINLPLERIIDDSEKIKVLAIGNSYAVDAYAYLEEIARNEGVYLELRIAQQSGASFTKHWKTWTAETEQGRKKYTENGEAVDIAHFLEDGTEYDFITIQSSILNAKPGEYLNSAEHLVKYIRERQPKAEIVIHQTWSCEKGSPVEGFVKNYKGDRDAMTKQIEKDNEIAIKVLADVETDSGLKVSLDGKPLRYIPAGNAVTIARQSEMFDTTFTGGASWDDVNKYLAPDNTEDSQGVVSLHRDSYHMSRRYGRYLVGLVWYRCLTGNSVLNNTYTNKSYPIPEDARKIINEAAQKAVDDTGIWN